MDCLGYYHNGFVLSHRLMNSWTHTLYKNYHRNNIISIYTYIYIYIYTYIRIYIYIYIIYNIYIYAHVRVCVYVCMYVFLINICLANYYNSNVTFEVFANRQYVHIFQHSGAFEKRYMMELMFYYIQVFLLSLEWTREGI